MTTERINKEQLKIFNSYGGDIDGFVHMNKTHEKEIFGEHLDDKWTFLTNTLQDSELIAKRLSSYDYTKNALTEINEKTDEETFRLLTSKIGFYDDFQKVREILETIRDYTDKDTDTVWAGYDNADEFLTDLNADIEKVKFCDFATLDKLEMEFAPTSTYQELSLSNGWSENFLELAKRFDKLNEKLKKHEYSDNKKHWWKFWD